MNYGTMFLSWPPEQAEKARRALAEYAKQVAPKCERCKFGLVEGGESSPLITRCRRYPKPELVSVNHWCGEFVESFAALPKRIL